MTRTLDHLFDRNVAWAARKTHDDPEFFRRLAGQQAPNYLWIGCSDSRVTANDVLDLDPGEVFVHRNIANFVHTSDMNILSVLEFAVERLEVEHIVVCGHYGCGGVARAMSGALGSMLDHWLQPLSTLYRQHRVKFDAIANEELRIGRLCELNVEMQVRRLAATPIVEKAWSQGRALHLHGWIYAIHDGLLRDLGPHLSSTEDANRLASLDERVDHPVKPLSAPRRRAYAALAAGTPPVCPVCR